MIGITVSALKAQAQRVAHVDEDAAHIKRLPRKSYTMEDNLDASLMTVVNAMGFVVFALVAVFHFITATPKDAEV